MSNQDICGSLIHAAFYTGGLTVPSARFRVRQYVGALSHYDIRSYEYPSRAGCYPPASAWLRPGWFIEALIERGMQIPSSYDVDVVVFQRELISTTLTLEPFFSKPRILDVDDAIWLHRRGAFAGKLAERCNSIICGNKYLADYFYRYNKNISIIPTPVDTRRFRPLFGDEDGFCASVIGWSGTAANIGELKCIEPAIRKVMQQCKRVRLRVVSNQQPNFTTLPADRVDFIAWSPGVEVAALQDLTVGIMPLQDTPWTRGKCAFKMLTYMACGVPVIVSPVGMNRDILVQGDLGLAAEAEDEWVSAILQLLDNQNIARRMGAVGRSIVESQFSVDVLAEKLAHAIRDVAR